MASYWIVVPHGNQELLDPLSLAFHGRTGFSVIVDRRSQEGDAHDAERRAGSAELGRDEIIVAEQAERRAGHARDVLAARTRVRVPARRRTARPSAPSDPHRLATL